MSRGFPSMTALLGLLAIAGYQNRDELAEMLGGQGSNGPGGQGPGGQQGHQQQGGLGGLLGGLGGMAGGAGAGGLLNGGLGELVERFKQNGQGEAAESWVGHGPNKEMSPQELEQAIGPDVLDDLSQRTDLPRDELLARLSRDLPKAVDSYTPDGRLPA
ncbi:YidB family protein [Microvirga lenta]|uniref:YidB family protein n=1 Tax=Microvirga lenta TaxID=2881337 RepID=UPI001CFF9473|nr:YidB family protein [Microvirga lenta]MCB5175909.1 YidB family protein [Microvirga lenta]